MDDRRIRFPSKGTLEFKKPSFWRQRNAHTEENKSTGLPEHDDALEIPVFFQVNV